MRQETRLSSCDLSPLGLEQEIKSSVSVQRIIGKQIRGNIFPDLQRHERDVKGGDLSILFVWLCSPEGSSQRIVAEEDNSVKTIY